MLNIRLLANYSLSASGGCSKGVCVDAIGERLFVISSGGCIDVFDRSNFRLLSSIKHEAISKENLKAFRYNDESGACAVAVTQDGSFYFLRHTNLIEVECVAKLDEGVAAASWSPDGDICALVTNTSNPRILLVTSKLDTILEKPLFDGDEKFECSAVSVGWGKKETQFHASEGKMAAFSSKQQSTPAHELDDRCMRISWRPDGQCFVVNFVNASSGCRDFRVFNRNGTLFSTMEPAPGITQALTWRPYSVGGLIAASCQLTGTKAKIIFFEKNGLRHAEFELPFASEHIRFEEICCNADGKLFYIVCEDFSTRNKMTHVLVYTTSNFHWYLKQKLTFESDSFNQLWLDGPDKPLRAYILTGNTIEVYDWGWIDNWDSKHNCSAVVDGCELLITPFKLCCPPPPMCHVKCHLPDTASVVSFCVDPECNAPITRFAVVSVDGACIVFEYAYAKLEESPKPVKSFQLPKTRSLRGLVFSKDHVVFITSCGPASSLIHVADMNGNTSEHAINGCVLTCNFDPDAKFCLLQLDDGKLLRFDPEKRDVSNFDGQKGFNRSCARVQIAQIQNQSVPIGLASSITGGPIYLGSFQLSLTATSFALDKRFLVFTTTEHRAYFVPLTTSKSVEELAKWFNNVSSGPSTPLQALLTRPVERGATVFSVDTVGDGSIVLEMPRGNIEKVHPRPLLLETVVRLVNEKMAYGKAFQVCLKHRISLNLLHDLNPEQLSRNSALFVKQIGSVENLNLFIFDLVDDNVVETLYPSMNELNVTPKISDAPSGRPKSALKSSFKVDKICNSLIETFKSVDDQGYFLSTLTCFAKRNGGADLESAVIYLKALSDKYPQSKNRMLDEGLKHLARLADVNDLYDIALGTYDLDLALTVAERTQKDPREYRQELTDFSHLQPVAYRRYRIDKRVARPEAAVRHLIEAGESFFDELFNYVTIEKPKMLLLAAKMVEMKSSENYSAEKSKILWIAYIERIGQERRYLEAGICALRSELYEEALDYLSRNNSWELATVASLQLRNVHPIRSMNTDEELPCLLTAEAAAEANNFSASGKIYENILGDFEKALSSFINGHDLFSAYKLLSCKMFRGLSEIRCTLEETARGYIEQQISSIEESIVELTEFANRLVAIDNTKQMISAFPYGDADLAVGDDYAESVAAASTTASTAVRSTTSRGSSRSNSSRSSRQSSSRWRLRVGSPSERFAIMERLVACAKDRLPMWRRDLEELNQVCLLILDPSILWVSKDNLLKQLNEKLREAIAALRYAVELGWSHEYMAALAASAMNDGPVFSNEMKTPSGSLHLLDERIRYSPMCFIYSEENKISSSGTSNIFNVITRLMS